MRHAGTQTIETQRLLLRRLTPADAPAMFRNWASDPEVTRFLRWDPHPDAEMTRQLLAAWAELYPNPDYYQWAIVEKATGEVFGSFSLMDDALNEQVRPELWNIPGLDFTHSQWEVGYCIGKAWWNKGFMTEALRAVMDYIFEQTDIGWIASCHAVDNPASGRVMEHAGFVYDHNDLYHRFDGTPVECRVYALTREAHLKEKGTRT
ncbi:MAG: GNAT family N-acetyltransferase [Faecalibacterium sp.]|nr:GNAT family N-acetyltransferase [Faecalibacterium sp.]